MLGRHIRFAPRHLPLLLAAGMSLCAGACAQNGPSLAPQIGQKAPDTYKLGQPYQLSQEELGLDCKKMTGRMQIRILQVRDVSLRSNTSAASRTIQQTVTPVLGGTSHGADPVRDQSRDRAWLEAMNKQLAAKKCAVFDLESELRPHSIRDTPTPVPNPDAEPKKRR